MLKVFVFFASVFVGTVMLAQERNLETRMSVADSRRASYIEGFPIGYLGESLGVASQEKVCVGGICEGERVSTTPQRRVRRPCLSSGSLRVGGGSISTRPLRPGAGFSRRTPSMSSSPTAVAPGGIPPLGAWATGPIYETREALPWRLWPSIPRVIGFLSTSPSWPTPGSTTTRPRI